VHVVILGGGVIGVTSAYYLALAGHEVTVLERMEASALDTSFANAGQISPGYAAPWAAPGIPLKAIKWMVQKHAPLSISPDGSVFQLRWMWQMLRNCSADRYAVNKQRMVHLAEYSRDCFKELRAATGIAYEGRQQGTLQVFRTAAQLDGAQKDIRVLTDAGVPFELLTPQQIAALEPGMASITHKLTGGLRLPNDETGDCHLFTTQLALMAQQLGVKFRYGVEIDVLDLVDGKIAAVVCGSERVVADAYVVAMGSFSRKLMLPITDIPVYPVKGYSITAPIRNAATAPLSTVLDETYKIAITRFDDRIRVGGMAELVGFDAVLTPQRRATLTMVVNDLFPGAGDTDNATFWTGLRPMTPDGTPLVGATSIPNLYLNTGHGTLGWTMSCGSGRVLADLISGRPCEIDARDLALSRY